MAKVGIKEAVLSSFSCIYTLLIIMIKICIHFSNITLLVNDIEDDVLQKPDWF